MPINDSAGVGVNLVDKSQRASVAVGFRSAGAIESDRGLCNTPMLISSEEDYVKTFGTPSMERHGLAAMEAYLLAQRRVPQVLTRAKNPEIPDGANTFGLMKLFVEDGKLSIDTSMAASSIKAPVNDNEVYLYFKGEGDYCKGGDNSNIVVRFSKPLTQSAYAKDGQSIRMQVFDFDGAQHIDEDTTAELAFNPDVATVLASTGALKLAGYKLGDDITDAKGATRSQPVNITAFVNGRVHKLAEFDYGTITTGSGNWGLFDKFSAAVKGATYADGKPVINSDWEAPLDYTPSAGGDYGVYNLYTGKGDGPQELNCFGLSISLTATAEVVLSKDGESGKEPAPGFYNFPCGSITVYEKTVTKTDSQSVEYTDTYYVAKFTISTGLYLKNRNSYMFMGSHIEDVNGVQTPVQDNSYWASHYAVYCKEDFVFSPSYDDYNANYDSMQADAVIGQSNYIVPKSSDVFSNGFAVDAAVLSDLHYFGGILVDNSIRSANKSYSYSQALIGLLSDNLTRWRCLATPNLGDVMSQADFISAINAAGESTLGLSNIGRSASTDVFGNLEGRHGNRFIADYAQYAYRTLAGKRTAVTMATLVTDLLNVHYNAGIEARPPFGYNYGQVSCLGLSQQYSGAERNILARQHKVNPVIEDGGFFIWEERTSQLTDTSLSDTHCIVSYIWMKFAIYDAMKAFVAEYNDEATVNRGLTLLNQLKQTFISRNYIEEAIVSADKNVIGDEVLRFDMAIRFKGVARFVDVYITAYSQTQTLAISLAQEA